jgi:hypothetical protein
MPPYFLTLATADEEYYKRNRFEVLEIRNLTLDIVTFKRRNEGDHWPGQCVA